MILEALTQVRVGSEAVIGRNREMAPSIRLLIKCGDELCFDSQVVFKR
jgi:hypothetical protein